MAEWLGTALQKLLLRFESARDLSTKKDYAGSPFLFMKHSQLIGIIAVLALFGICFMPWIIIESQHITVTGFASGNTSFGKPGYLNAVLSFVCLVLFAVPKIWAKRTNVFIAAINLAWAFRNYLLLSSCMLGECPEKKAGLYLLLLASAVIQAMALLPKLPVPVESD